jgi:hypothetical protein
VPGGARSGRRTSPVYPLGGGDATGAFLRAVLSAGLAAVAHGVAVMPGDTTLTNRGPSDRVAH